MRLTLLLFWLCLWFGPIAYGQAPQRSQSDSQLENLMRGWEKSLGSLQSVTMDCERTAKDRVFQTTDKHKGVVKFLKPKEAKGQAMASLEMFKEVGGKAQLAEKYLFTQGILYEFAPGDKIIRKHPITPQKGGRHDENILSFLFSKKLADVLERYQISFMPSKDKFFYLKIQPKHEQDKAEFTEAWIALYPSNLLLAMIHFRQPNGNEVTWQFRNVEANVALNENDFAPPEPPPPGWQLQRVPEKRSKSP